MLATLALGAVHDATCTNHAAHDTALLATTINASAAGDLVRIHGMCLVRETICLRGDCASRRSSPTTRCTPFGPT